VFEMIPFPERRLGQLRSEMDSLFNRFFEGFPMRPRTDGEWLPAVDASETPKEILVRAEIPGMDPKDIDISLDSNCLILRGERKQKHEEKEENYYRIERRYGAFSMSVMLPAEVDPDKVNATYKDGILEIHMPKTKEAAVKRIQVKAV
jgi:HSP20 family protein